MNKINELIENLGLTPTQVIDEWIETGTVTTSDLKDIIDLANKKRNVLKITGNDKHICPGMFLLRDGQITEDCLNPDDVIAIISFVDKDKAFALCVKSKTLPLLTQDDIWEKHTCSVNGRKSTQKLSELKKNKDSLVEDAIDYCNNYCDGVIQKKMTFLPSLEEAKNFIGYTYNIRSAYYKVFGRSMDGFSIWTSTKDKIKNEYFSYSFKNFITISMECFCELDVFPVVELEIS